MFKLCVQILSMCSLSGTEICEYLTIQVHWGVQNWVARAGKHLKMDGARQSHNRIKFGCINKLSTLLTQTTKYRFTISLSDPSLIIALPLQSLSLSLLWDLTDVTLACEDSRNLSLPYQLLSLEQNQSHLVDARWKKSFLFMLEQN